MQEQHDENHKNNNEQKQQFNELKVKKSLRRKLTVFPSNDFDNCNNINNLSPSTYSNNNSNNHSPNSNNNPFSTSPLTTIVTTTPINKIKKKNNEMASYSDDALYRSKSTVTMYNNINNNNNTGSNTGITSNKSNLRHALVTTNSNNNNNNNTLKQQLTPNEMSMSPSSTTSSSSLNNEIKEPFIKVALLGTIGVGKTSLIQRYLTNTFEEMYLSTTSPIISYKTLINLQQNNNLQNNENNVPDTSPSQHKNFYEQQSPVNNNQNSGNNQEMLIEVFDTSGIDIQSYQGPTIIPSRILSNNTNNNNYNNNNSYNNNLLSLSVNKENNNGHLSGTLDLQSVCSVESLDSIDGNDSRLMTSINSGDNMSNVNNTMYDNNIDNIPEILQNELILNCDVFLLVFSLDDYDSYQQCQFIYNALYKLKKKSLKKGIPKLSIILIGNKSDVPNEEKIIESEQVLDDVKTKFIFGSNCEYIETSAKLNLNINNIFNNLYKRKLLQQKRSKSFFLKDTSNIVKKQQFNNNTSKLEIISQKDNDVANDSAKTTKSITNNNNNTANKVHNDKDSNVPLKKTSSMFVPIKARFSTMGRFDLRSEQHDKKKCNIQ